VICNSIKFETLCLQNERRDFEKHFAPLIAEGRVS
jgi:hypothetical protein